jgi:hypothetical protein
VQSNSIDQIAAAIAKAKQNGLKGSGLKQAQRKLERLRSEQKEAERRDRTRQHHIEDGRKDPMQQPLLGATISRGDSIMWPPIHDDTDGRFFQNLMRGAHNPLDMGGTSPGSGHTLGSEEKSTMFSDTGVVFPSRDPDTLQDTPTSAVASVWPPRGGDMPSGAAQKYWQRAYLQPGSNTDEDGVETDTSPSSDTAPLLPRN